MSAAALKRDSRAALAGADMAEKVRSKPEPRKFKWLDAIAEDAELAPVAFRVGYLIRCFYGDNETGRCEAAMDTIARRLKVNEKTIRRAVEYLEKRGYLAVTHGAGGTTPTSCCRHFRSGQICPPQTILRTTTERTFLSPRSGHLVGQKCPTLLAYTRRTRMGGPPARPLRFLLRRQVLRVRLISALRLNV
jgi:hypothetical protein